MAEKGSRSPASGVSAFDNLVEILKERGVSWSSRSKASRAASDVTDALRMELRKKVPEGDFKRGGTVRKTGVYKLHAGERVVKAPARRRSASVTLPRRRK